MQHSGTCANCGKTYTRNRPLRGDTCSRLCSARRHKGKPLEKRTCIACGSEFFRKPSSPVRYCSIGCFNRRTPTRKADMIRVCVGCGKTFKRFAGHLDQRYCSMACSRPRYRSAPRICKGCGKEFRPTSRGVRYCERACAARTAAVRTRAAGILPRGDYSERPKACERCGWGAEPGVLEKHHKDRNRKNNHRSNLEYLCPTCHTLDHFKAKDGQFKNNHGRTVHLP